MKNGKWRTAEKKSIAKRIIKMEKTNLKIETICMFFPIFWGYLIENFPLCKMSFIILLE
jgi:hypothetical protein